MPPSVLFGVLAAAMLLDPVTGVADVRPAGVFSDHMVLQRDKPAPVWGWAAPDETVTVTFAGQTKSATAGKDGKWRVTLDPLALSTRPQTMTLAGKNRVQFEDILVGDVWLCSGQSNMGRNVGRSLRPEGMPWEYPRIRYWSAGDPSKYPVERWENSPPWKVCQDQESTLGCCAVGFFFGRRIQEDVPVPIGLLWQAYAGSLIQEWMPPQGWHLDPRLKDFTAKVDRWYPETPLGRETWRTRLAEIEVWLAQAKSSLAEDTPFPFPQPRLPEAKDRDIGGFYNGKIHPLVPLAIKGVLWYQGESDGRNNRWAVMLKAMVASWRELFSVAGDGRDIPFYWVQIQRSGDYCSPLARDEQLKALKLVPHGGMAVLLDLDVNVHPVNKVDSGIRLALWALAKDYGKQDLVYSGPLYRSYHVQSNQVIVEFDHAAGGLMVGRKEKLNPVQAMPGAELANVQIAGQDQRWHPAKAKIVGPTLVVSAADVPEPVAVRYCYQNIPPEPFLYNQAGLPAAQFRTDSW